MFWELIKRFQIFIDDCDEIDFLFVVEGSVGVMIDLRVFKLDFTFGSELIPPKKQEKYGIYSKVVNQL